MDENNLMRMSEFSERLNQARAQGRFPRRVALYSGQGNRVDFSNSNGPYYIR